MIDGPENWSALGAREPDDRGDRPAIELARSGRHRGDNRRVELATALNRRELQRYLDRVGDRWPIETASAGRRAGRRRTRRAAAARARARVRGRAGVPAFEGMPWLERVYHAGVAVGRAEMGAPADVHCYTPDEFERKRATLRVGARGEPSGGRPARRSALIPN